MENNKRSRVQNMNDFVNNNVMTDDIPEEENSEVLPDIPEDIPPVENSSGVIARTVYPSSRSVSASRYAGASYRTGGDEEPGIEEYRERLAQLDSSERQKASQARTSITEESESVPAKRTSAPERRASAQNTQRPAERPSAQASSRQQQSSSSGRSVTPKKSSSRSVTPVKRNASSTPVSARERIQSADPRQQEKAPSKPGERQSAAPEKVKSAPSKSVSAKSAEPGKKTNTRTTAANRKYTDIVDERRSRRAAEEAENVPEKKKHHVFRTLVIIYSVLLFVILAAGLVFLYIYLGKFEESQPNKVAESIVANYSTTARLSSFIKANADKIDCIDNLDDFTEAYTRYIEGKKVSYVEKNSSTAEVPAYNLVTDGTIVGTFTLKKTGTGDFNTAIWGLDTYDIVTSFPLGYTLSVTVPEGSTVQVNDTVLDSGYLTSSGIPEILQNSAPYLNDPPKLDTYTVPILTGTPHVLGKDKSGSSLTFTESREDKEITFTAGSGASEDFISEVDPLVRKAIEVWGLYFINMDSSLDLYIKQGTDLYANIFGSEDMDPILTWLYNFEQIEDYEFEYIEADNYQQFSDECFTVDIRYKLDITFTEAGMEDDNQKLDATWVWVPDGDSWSITDVIYK